MQISLENKCVDLYGQRFAKLKFLDFADDKLKYPEENMALVIHEKEKHSEELIYFKSANEDLKVQLLELDKKFKESEAKYKATAERVSYYESVKYTAKVIDIYLSLSEYHDERFNKSNTFFDRGCVHILHQFH